MLHAAMPNLQFAERDTCASFLTEMEESEVYTYKCRQLTMEYLSRCRYCHQLSVFPSLSKSQIKMQRCLSSS